MELTRLHGEGHALAEKIVSMPATTLDGFRAKALAVAGWCWDGDFDWGAIGTDEKLMAAIVRDLARLPAV